MAVAMPVKLFQILCQSLCCYKSPFQPSGLHVFPQSGSELDPNSRIKKTRKYVMYFSVCLIVYLIHFALTTHLKYCCNTTIIHRDSFERDTVTSDILIQHV